MHCSPPLSPRLWPFLYNVHNSLVNVNINMRGSYRIPVTIFIEFMTDSADRWTDECLHIHEGRPNFFFFIPRRDKWPKWFFFRRTSRPSQPAAEVIPEIDAQKYRKKVKSVCELSNREWNRQFKGIHIFTYIFYTYFVHLFRIKRGFIFSPFNPHPEGGRVFI